MSNLDEVYVSRWVLLGRVVERRGWEVGILGSGNSAGGAGGSFGM